MSLEVPELTIEPEWEAASDVLQFYYYCSTCDFELPKVTNIDLLSNVEHVLYVLPESLLTDAEICEVDACTSENAVSHFMDGISSS